MNQIERDKTAFQLAYDYLLNLNIPGLDSALLDKYMHLPDQLDRPNTIAGLYQRLLFSAQNSNMKAGVIGGALGGVERLAIVLDEFNPTYVINTYPDWESLLDTIENELQPRGKIRRSPQSIWPRYCQTIRSAAAFMQQFETAAEFYTWAEFFNQDKRVQSALPLLLEVEIYGVGFPLACDFLKELGFDYAKPDVHLKDIFMALDLCPPNPTNYQIFQTVLRIARHVDTTAYAVDKLFWLIGSGWFYDDPHIGKEGRIGRQKQAFIDLAHPELHIP